MVFALILVEHDGSSVRATGHARTRGQCAAVSSVFYARQTIAFLRCGHGRMRLDAVSAGEMEQVLAALRALRRAWPRTMRIQCVRKLTPD